MKIKSKIAYAVVKKNDLEIDVMNIFSDNDVTYDKKTEVLVKIKIEVANK